MRPIRTVQLPIRGQRRRTDEKYSLGVRDSLALVLVVVVVVGCWLLVVGVT